MDKEQLDENRGNLLGEAAGSEHERLKGALVSWAKGRGFKHGFGRLSSGIPDVLLGTDGTPNYLLVGDAKDSAHETADTFATFARVRGYMQDFGTLIGKKWIRGGIFAIVTNTRESAQRWVPFLTSMAENVRLSAGGAPPDFQIDQIDDKTFIVFW